MGMDKGSVGFVIFTFQISIAPVYWSVNGSSRSFPSSWADFQSLPFCAPPIFTLQGIISLSIFCLTVWTLALKGTFRQDAQMHEAQATLFLIIPLLLRFRQCPIPSPPFRSHRHM